MSNGPKARLENWQQVAKKNGRLIIPASHVNIHFTIRRHGQNVEFDTPISLLQCPEFFCVYATEVLIRGEMRKWIWESSVNGKTRLWIPTELSWRATVIGDGVARILPLDGKITGSAGTDNYRRTDCWWVSFYPKT